MIMLEKLTKVSKKILALIFAYIVLIGALVFSDEISTSVLAAINLIINTLIPSMFVFMIISSFVANSPICRYISIPFWGIYKFIFKVSGAEMGIVLLSLIGGYPVGAKLLADAVKNKKMSPEKASVMLSYCVNCSPAFLITAVGAGIFSSKMTGFFIYVSQVAACLIVGFLVSFRIKKLKSGEDVFSVKKHEPYSFLLVTSVNSSIKALALMCGLVILFSVVSPACNYFLGKISEELSLVVGGLIEVTNGCRSLVGTGVSLGACMAALFTSFGGICVHMQTYAMLINTQIKMKFYWIYRICYCFISVSITYILISVFPQVDNCIAVNNEIYHKIYSVSPISSAFLFFSCILLLFFSRKSVKIKTSNAQCKFFDLIH
ncbi:MAG: hypothetical protein RR036_03060 [Oscillospiraceae bacterium]